MSKSELITLLAQVPDNDGARLDRVAAALAGNTDPERPESFRLLKMGEASALTGLSRCTIWRAIRDGQLNAVEIRKGSKRIAENELRRFVAGAAE